MCTRINLGLSTNHVMILLIKKYKISIKKLRIFLVVKPQFKVTTNHNHKSQQDPHAK